MSLSSDANNTRPRMVDLNFERHKIARETSINYKTYEAENGSRVWI